jgi:hypothetical protein
VVSLAQEREQWKEIVQAVTQKCCKSQEEKVVKQREKKSKIQHEARKGSKLICWASVCLA